MNLFLSDLLKRGVLAQTSIKNIDSLVLTKPKSILITKQVQAEIKSRYSVSSEIGGVMAMRVLDGGSMVTDTVYFFENTQSDPSKYSPNYTQYHKAIAQIVANKQLPFLFHTHPTKLGISSYDYQRAKFYLTSSYADRDVSFTPVNYQGSNLVLPQCIFVGDARFTGGLGVSMYSGNIFPLSFNRFGQGEILVLEAVAVVAFFTLIIERKYNVLKVLLPVLAIVIIYYLYHRPKYVLQPSGDILITV